MHPTISVVIPLYNRFDRLKYAVESVLAQTLPVSEVILVDDGSTDDTPELLPRYIAENVRWRERVIYVRQENQGPSVARKNGILTRKVNGWRLTTMTIFGFRESWSGSSRRSPASRTD